MEWTCNWANSGKFPALDRYLQRTLGSSFLTMAELYRIPALALLSMLLVVFALLYLQTRSTRRLLWLIGWSLAVLRIVMEVAGVHRYTDGFAVSNAGMVLAPLMFLGSMSPLAFKHWPRVLYAYAFAVPT